MKRLRVTIFVHVMCFSSLFSQTYYVSSSNGSDNNDGLSESSAWKTIAKLNSRNFNPGDQILFRKGDIWVGEQLSINRSGTAGNPITYSAYGTGLKPIITTKMELPGWNTAGNWTDVSSQIGQPNVWRMDFTTKSSIDRLWINDTEAKLASCYSLQNWYMELLKAGDNGDGTYGVNSTHTFFFDRSPNNRFYIYSQSNPAVNYKSIEIPGKIENGVITYETVSLRDADYVTLDGLDIQGGMYASIGLSGSDYVTITNCNIGKNTNVAGINGDAGFGIDKTSDYVTVSNDTIDSYWDYDYIFYTQRTPYGLRIGGGASNWDVYNNYIKDWWFDFMVGSWFGTGLSENHNIHDNEMTNPNMSFSKFMQIESSYSGSWNTSTNFYNNYCHNSTLGIQVMSANNKFYFNIFENLRAGINSHSGVTEQDRISGSGIAFGLAKNFECQGGYGTAVNNYIFNNTFYNLNNEAHTHESPSVYNNLYLNCSRINSQVRVAKQWNFSDYKNNLFYKTGSNNSAKFLYSSGLDKSYTVVEFNALGGTISGNIFPDGKTLSQIMNTDYTLPSKSPALNAGNDISALVPDGFTDRLGNVVNRKNPNIGAIDNTAQESTGFQIYFQGAYADGIMSSALQKVGVIPKAQPYNISPWNYDGNETVQTVPSEIVDWVLVELRSEVLSSSIAARRVGFIRNDGSIVDLDGRSKLRFDGVNNGNYYVVIRHRNHLSIMSAVKVTLSGLHLEYDFTTSPSKAYGNELADLGNGRFGMYAGDGDGNGIINVLDYSTVGNSLFQIGYLSGDHDLNGRINVLDYGRTNQNLLKISNVP